MLPSMYVFQANDITEDIVNEKGKVVKYFQVAVIGYSEEGAKERAKLDNTYFLLYDARELSSHWRGYGRGEKRCI